MPASGLTSVSYTHLDVYKRQALLSDLEDIADESVAYMPMYELPLQVLSARKILVAMPGALEGVGVNLLRSGK